MSVTVRCSCCETAVVIPIKHMQARRRCPDCGARIVPPVVCECGEVLADPKLGPFCGWCVEERTGAAA